MTENFDPSHATSDPDRLQALDAYAVRNLGTDAGLDGVVMLARTLCATPTALVTFVDNDHQWFAARSGFGLSAILPCITLLHDGSSG